MDRGRNSRSDDGTCPRTGDEKKGEKLVFEDNFKKILLILELKSISKRLTNEEIGYKIGKRILERI